MKPFKKHSFSARPLNKLSKKLKNIKRKPQSQRNRNKKNKKSKLKIIFYTCLSIFLIGTISLVSFVIYAINDKNIQAFAEAIDKKDPNAIVDFMLSESSIIYDNTAKQQLYSIHGDENRLFVPLSKISQNFLKALLAAEDDEFFKHPGLDFGGIAKAACFEFSKIVHIQTFGGLCNARGGSTLTNQLLDNVLPPEPTGGIEKYKRKMQEWYLSWKLENRDGIPKQKIKEEILELYTNKIAFGAMSGVETASLSFFGKSAKDLTIAESAILAAVIKMPTYYSPWGNHPYPEITIPPEDIKKKNLRSRQEILALKGVTLKDGLRGKEFELAGGKKEYFPGRADWVLKKMYSLNFINKNEYTKAVEELKKIQFKRGQTNIKAPHFVMYVREYLEEKFGKELVEQGGLTIITTLDMDLQKKAEKIIAKKTMGKTCAEVEIGKECAEVKNNETCEKTAPGKECRINSYGSNEQKYDAKNAALIAIDNKTGHIKAMVGSRDYWEVEEAIEGSEEVKGNDGKVNVILSRRLPGSSYKPIVFAAAFSPAIDLGSAKDDNKENKSVGPKLSPGSVLFDVKTNFANGWTPANYDGKFTGPVSVRYALGHSLNIPAVKAALIAKPKKVVAMSNKIGVTLMGNADTYGGAISLGAGEVRPLDMAQGFSIFANNGKKIPITPILKVLDKKGNILIDNTEIIEEPEQVLNEEVAYLITDILADTEARGPGWNTNLQLPGRINAVKTGTSNKKIKGGTWPFDTWTVGYTPQITTVVWAGNNDGSVLNHQASGFTTAAPIWKEFMIEAHKELPVENFKMPKGIKIIPVSKLSGNLPLPDTDPKLIVKEKFASFYMPTKVDNALKMVEVNKLDEKLPNDFTPPDCLEKRAVLNFHSYNYGSTEDPQYYSNWEEPVQKWVNEKSLEYLAELEINAKNIMAKEPTQKTTLHTSENSKNKPMITIVSPVNFGIITPPYIDINTQISAKNGLAKTKYYFDETEKPLKEVTGSANKTTLNIGNLTKGTNHTIKVVAIDNMCYSSASTIEVKVGSDDSPPTVNIIYPQKDDILIAGSIVSLSADAFDEKSAIDKIEFYIDGKKLGEVKERPFNLSYKVASGSAYRKMLVKAYDTAGNVSETSFGFYVEKSTQTKNEFSIFSPKNNSSVKANENINVSISISEDMINDFENLTVFLQQESGKKTILNEFTKDQMPDNRVFNISYTQPEVNVIIYAQIKFADKNYFSNRVKVFTK